MNTHQLLDWEEDLDLQILAIASHLQDFQIAHAINKTLKTKLQNKRSSLSVLTSGVNASFSLYFSEPTRSIPSFYLVDNQAEITSYAASFDTLFNNDEYFRPHLIKSLKKWHYLIVTEDSLWFNLFQKMTNSNQILLSQHISYQGLSKKDRAILKSITYE